MVTPSLYRPLYRRLDRAVLTIARLDRNKDGGRTHKDQNRGSCPLTGCPAPEYSCSNQSERKKKFFPRRTENTGTKWASHSHLNLTHYQLIETDSRFFGVILLANTIKRLEAIDFFSAGVPTWRI